MSSTRTASVVATALMLLVSLVIGCAGKSTKVKVYPVSGEVFYKDKPADGAVIHFHPVVKGAPPAFATVQMDGTFLLTTYTDSDGAAAGDYYVTITWREETPGDGETIIGPDRLGDRYSRRDETTLRATVTEGDNLLEPFKIKG